MLRTGHGAIFSDILHEPILESARAHGFTYMVYQTREYPYPNTLARKVHVLHGWLDTGSSMLYPYTDGSSAWGYILARVHVKDPQTPTQSQTRDQSNA
jgi:hypothetical protein